MLTLFAVVLMIWIFGKLLIFSVRASWGIIKILFTVVCIPLVLVGLLIAGVVYIVLPLLLVLGVVTAFASRR